MNNTEPDAEGIVDSAVLFTLGVLSGGLALDMGTPQPRNRTLRQSLIDLLLNSIKEGSFGPLRLVQRDDRLYLTGCGLMHPVDSPEHAEAVVAQLIWDLEPMLPGLGADVMLELEPFEDIDPAEESCPKDTARMVDGFSDEDDSSSITWHDCIEMAEPACDPCPALTATPTVTSEHTPAPAAHEPIARAEQQSVIPVAEVPATAPAADTPVIAPAATVPANPLPAGSCPITLAPLKRSDRQPTFEQIDRTLDEIMSRMQSRTSTT